MTDTAEWLGLADAVHRAGGTITYMQLYGLALSSRVESRRQGTRWQVRRSSLDRYLGQRRAQLSDFSRERM